VRGQQLAPRGVADPGRRGGRLDEVSEQEGREHPGGASSGEGPESLPFQLDQRFVADDVPVVAWGNLEDIAGTELVLRPIPEDQVERTGEDDAGMPGLAPLRPDLGTDVLRPPPAGLMDDPGDAESRDIDHVGVKEGQLQDLVGLVEVLARQVRHGLTCGR
jgi:hypothetical protein